MDFLFRYKPLVDAKLKQYLRPKTLLPFVTAGKTIRGCLVLYSYLLFKKTVHDRVLNAAAAMELIHSGFLIHDDIMDNDSIRRGMKAIHVQYDVPQAICIGDLLFFLGYGLLDPRVIPFTSRELAGVAIGQMRDIRKEADILTTYKYKTARYTFSLPFMIGATLAGAPKPFVSKLEKLGESLGLLFQIRDDELDHEKTTLLHLKSELSQKAKNIIRNLGINKTHKHELAALLTFCQNRKT